MHAHSHSRFSATQIYVEPHSQHGNLFAVVADEDTTTACERGEKVSLAFWCIRGVTLTSLSTVWCSDFLSFPFLEDFS